VDFKLIDPYMATYTLLVEFDGAFSMNQPNVGMISFWKRMGDNLGKLYLCRECDSFVGIDPETAGVCPSGHPVDKSSVYGEVLFRLTIPKWSIKLAEWVRKMDMDVDIILHRRKFNINIKEASYKAIESHRNGELLEKAKVSDDVSYLKYRLITDLNSGMSLEKAIEAFLKA